MTTATQNKENDSLKELKKLLEDDAHSNGDGDSLIPRAVRTGVIIRLSVIVIASVFLYVTGIFDTIGIVLTVLLIFVAIEALNVTTISRSHKKEQQGPHFPKTKKKQPIK